MESSILRANLEALLFVSEEPQSLMRLAEAIPDASREEVQQAMAALAEEYRDARYGIELVEVAGGFTSLYETRFRRFRQWLFERRRKRTLSKPALETLAIVA
jgi:chromosome segregation and condensation protein ScpB